MMSRCGRIVLAAAAALGLFTPATAEEALIGVGMALTGNYAYAGVPVMNGIKVAVEELNTSNFLGSRTIKLVAEDNASDKEQMITLIHRFATIDKTLAALGPLSSAEALAAAPAANQKEIVMLSTGVSPDILKAGPWSFKVTSSPATTMQVLAKYAVETLKAKRAGLLAIRDNDGSITQKNVVGQYFKQNGVEIVLDDTIAASEIDFTALSTKLTNVQPDVIFMTVPAEQGASLVIQARQAGLEQRVRFLAPQGTASESFIRIGGKAVEGSIIAADYFIGTKSEQNQAFVERHRRMFGKDPENWTGVGYTMMFLLATAIRDAGPGAGRERVRDALTALKSVPTILGNGTFSFGAGREPSYGATLITVQDGKFALAL